MCECGCTMNDVRYSLDGPMPTLRYLVTLSGACVNCDAPAGVSIERISPESVYWSDEYTEGPLPLSDWGDSMGAAIVCGYRKHEFTAAMSRHLIGVSSDELGEGGRIDEVGADVLAEEMYDDAQIRPVLATPQPSSTQDREASK
jgi:hypothetical protein